jgi:hypothetical protein
MKVGEARSLYSTQLKEYNQQKFKLAQQKNELKERIKSTENGAELYGDEAASLEITYNAVADKQEEYQKYMDQLMEQWSAQFDLVASEQNADAQKEAFEDMAKVMEVARRLMHGDIVPSSDEKKLLEFDDKLYQMAKNAQMMAQNKKRKEYDSLWDDEEKKEYEDPAESADEQEAFADGPEIVDVADTMAGAMKEGD